MANGTGCLAKKARWFTVLIDERGGLRAYFGTSFGTLL